MGKLRQFIHTRDFPIVHGLIVKLSPWPFICCSCTYGENMWQKTVARKLTSSKSWNLSVCMFVGTCRGVDNFWEVGGLSLYRATRSNLWMVRPSSMLVVKLLIRVREACSKILDLASYLVVRWHSQCTSGSNWEIFRIAVSERTFSALHRLKTWLLSTVQQVRLNWCTIQWQSAHVQCSQWVCCM